MRIVWLGLVALIVAGCSSVPQGERPSPLPAYTKDVTAKASWSHKLGAWKETPEGQVRPVVADGRLVVVDGLDWLHVYDARSGKLRWELRTGLAITGGIGVAGKSLLVGTRRGQVVAYALEDGHVLWRTSVSSEVLAPPAIAAGVAVIRSGDGTFAADTLIEFTHQRIFLRPVLHRTEATVEIFDDLFFIGSEPGDAGYLYGGSRT